MSDRVMVTLTFLKEHASLIQEHGITCSREVDSYEENLYAWEIDEVKHGDLLITNFALEKGIPFTARNEAGYEFGVANTHLRFTREGTALYHDFVEETEQYVHVTALERILAAPTLSDKEKVHELSHIVSKINHDTVPLPWDDQADFAKAYRTRLLLGDTTCKP